MLIELTRIHDRKGGDGPITINLEYVVWIGTSKTHPGMAEPSGKIQPHTKIVTTSGDDIRVEEHYDDIVQLWRQRRARKEG